MADTSEIFEKITQHWSQKLPFAVYNKPNANKLIGIFQRNDTLFHVEDFNEKGFVFAPFNTDKIILIPQNQSQVLLADFAPVSSNNQESTIVEIENSEAKPKHMQLVQKAVAAIRHGDFGKVVLSRKEAFSLKQFELNSIFQNLLNTYPTAFAYCFFHPKIGLWLGAFSEQLIRVESQSLHTMAVAGTQVFDENKPVVWETKEQAEQQFVTDFIVESLNEYVSNPIISEPYTMKAGNLIHIKTDIQAVLNEPSHLKEVIEILHPTPAVCGFPKAPALDFILKNEGYDREFYSGFLGELNRDFEKDNDSTDLYVNLRCMQIETDPKSKNRTVYLYVGGGVTKDSIPEKEWIETVNKTKTMKKILDQSTIN